MYQNIANQNPLLNHFNGYMIQNPNIIPFQNNHLINNNVHVMNNLNNYVQQHKTIQQNIPVYQQQMQTNQMQTTNFHSSLQNSQNPVNGSTKAKKNIDIIKDMLKPQIIKKNGNNNRDVENNYKVRKNVQKEAEQGNVGIEITNAPYKNIIKDKIVNKKVSDIREDDLIVHKVKRGTGGDDDLDIFTAELENKENEKEKINDELKIEFDIENYDKHKKKFDYKETFIKNLAFEQNTFDESKQDYIDFYKKKQKEAEDGLKLCDRVLENFVDEGIISKDELPVDKIQSGNNEDIDLKSVIANVLTDEIYDFSNNNTNKIPKKIIKSSTPQNNSQNKKIVQTKLIAQAKSIARNTDQNSIKNMGKNSVTQNNLINSKSGTTTKTSNSIKTGNTTTKSSNIINVDNTASNILAPKTTIKVKVPISKIPSITNKSSSDVKPTEKNINEIRNTNQIESRTIKIKRIVNV